MSLETPFFFSGCSKKRLFGVYHETVVNDQSAKVKVIICCHALFGEKLHSHRILVNFSRYAAAKGINVLRFDFQGNGESEGFFEDNGIGSWLEDVNAAIEWLSQKDKKAQIYLLGIRFGATLALKYAQQSQNIAGTIAWAPIFNMDHYLRSLLRSNLSAQMVVHKKIILTREELIAAINQNKHVNVDGYLLGKPFWDQAVKINLLNQRVNYECPVLLYQISPSSSFEKEYAIFQKYFNPKSWLETDIFREKKFWMPQRIVYPSCIELFQGTVNWTSGCKAIDEEDI